MIAGHEAVAAQEVVVPDITLAVRRRVVPSGIHMVPFAVDLHDIPRMVAVADVFDRNTRFFEQHFIRIGVSGADRGMLEDSAVRGVRNVRHIAGIQTHIVLVVQHQIIMQRLRLVVVAHIVGDSFAYDDLDRAAQILVLFSLDINVCTVQILVLDRQASNLVIGLARGVEGEMPIRTIRVEHIGVVDRLVAHLVEGIPIDMVLPQVHFRCVADDCLIDGVVRTFRIGDARCLMRLPRVLRLV